MGTPRQLKPKQKGAKLLREFLDTDRIRQGKKSVEDAKENPRKREIEECAELERKLTEVKKPKTDGGQPAVVDPMLWNPDVPREESKRDAHKVSYRAFSKSEEWKILEISGLVLKLARNAPYN